MAANVTTTTRPLASAAIRTDRRMERPAVRATRLGEDAAPAATYRDQTQDPTTATRRIADRILSETWGWS